MEAKSITAKLVLRSRFMFITCSEQVEEFTNLVRDEADCLKGLLVFLDSNLLLSKKHASKLSASLLYVLGGREKLGFNLLIVANSSARLDKRLERVTDYRAKILSSAIVNEEKEL